MISPIQIAAEAISKIIATSPSQRVLGAKLGAQLRVADPGFTPVAFQCRNLRQFIKSHVPAIEEKGRSGPDFIYGPAPSQSVASCLRHGSDYRIQLARLLEPILSISSDSKPGYR
jgi:hypothetical protein